MQLSLVYADRTLSVEVMTSYFGFIVLLSNNSKHWIHLQELSPRILVGMLPSNMIVLSLIATRCRDIVWRAADMDNKLNHFGKLQEYCDIYVY